MGEFLVIHVTGEPLHGKTGEAIFKEEGGCPGAPGGGKGEGPELPHTIGGEG